MPRVRVTLTGDKKIDRMFAHLPKKLENKIVRDAIKAAIVPIRDDAKRRAPRDEGDLQRAIVIRAMRRKRGFIGRSVIVDAKRLKRAGDESASKRVAGAFQEYGTQYAEADPFMRPAFEANERGVRMNAINEMKRKIIAAARSA